MVGDRNGTSHQAPSASFWRGRRVLVTGHTGFMGGWLATWLHELGAKVAGLALSPPTFPSFYETIGVRALLADEIIGDICDPQTVREALLRTEPELLFHLAAQPIVGTAFADPVATFATNVLGTVQVLDAARDAAAMRAVLAVTSDKVYENDESGRPCREDDRLGGREPYGTSKACAELVIACYRRAYYSARGIAVASIRAGNVIGGGDWAKDRLLPDMVRAFSQNRSLTLRHPNAVRPWQHVIEPLRGYLLLAEQMCAAPAPDLPDALNFGPGLADHRSVSWIAERCAALWGDGTSWTVERDNNIPDAAHLALDSDKAQQLLGWRSCLDLDGALRATIAWYKAHAMRQDMLAFSLRQIDEIGGCRPSGS